MKQILILLVCGIFSVCLADDPYHCMATQTIDPPANLSETWNYPGSFDISQNPPQYAAGQNCSWIFNVPKGMYAYFSLKGNTNKAGVLTMTDSIGYVTQFTVESSQPFFLLDPSFRVDLQAIGQGTLGMRVQWLQMNTTAFAPATLRMPSNSSPVRRTNEDFDTGLVVEADSRVSILSMSPETTFTDLTPYMGVVQVFDGPDMNATFRGNLLQIMNSKTNFVSSGKYVTLFALFPGFQIGNTVVFQDYNDVKDFKHYQGVTCILPNICQVSLNATQGTAAALRYAPGGFFVKGISMSQTNKLSVYNDYVTTLHKLADYTSTTSKTNIPQEFFGKFTTFVLEKDQATIQLSGAAGDAQWTTPFKGRRGFIASPNYGVSTTENQKFNAVSIGGNGRFNISFDVDRSAIVQGSSLTVTVFDGSSTTVDQTYSPSNFPAGPVYAKGDKLSVQYDTSVQTSGAFVSFSFDEYNSASSCGLFGALLILLWVMLSS